MRTAVDVPGETVRAVTPGLKDKPIADPVEVQQTLLRFADEYSKRMVNAADRLRRGTNALPPAELLQAKIGLTSETCSIASGPNPIANLLDMTVSVTVTRIAVEDHWRPEVFGDSAQPMLDYCRIAETNVWHLAAKVLKPEQLAELRTAIETWRRENPLPDALVATRALDFASRVGENSHSQAHQPGSVFSLFNLDPLAGIDPAVREIAQTRMFAERALFVGQKLPTLLRWQTELLSVNAVETPAVQQLVANTTSIAASIERFASVAEKLPGQLSAERAEILKALESQEKTLSPLVQEVRQSLTAGTQMATSLNTTVTTFDALMKRFGVGETKPAGPPKTNAEPFRILDYAATAAQLEGTARELADLLGTFDRTIGSTNLTKLTAQVGPAVEQAQTGGRELVNYAFKKSILLVGIVLAAALAYRFLSARLTPTRTLKPTETSLITEHRL